MVPILGRIPCGSPVLAQEDIEDYVRLPENLFGRGDFYFLRAKGNSMVYAGIDSGVFPVVRLTKIFRQAATSRIITNAHRINRGQYPDLSNGKKTDFFFVGREDPEIAAEEIVELVKRKLPGFYKVPPASIQVLTPMQRGVVGAANLNQVLQEAINPNSPGLRRGGIELRQRDKVMQI